VSLPHSIAASLAGFTVLVTAATAVLLAMPLVILITVVVHKSRK